MGVEIVRANIDDAPEILELQKLAYQKEAVLYDDWTIPPLTQTLSEIQTEYENNVFLLMSCKSIIDSFSRYGDSVIEPFSKAVDAIVSLGDITNDRLKRQAVLQEMYNKIK